MTGFSLMKTLLSATLLLCLPALAGKLPSVAEFTPEESEKLGWRIVNDGVMGGLSQGKREISDDGVLRFWGDLSLKNNGGFSSLRTETVERDLSGAEGVRLRVRGDGRSYQVRLTTDAEFRGREMSFMAEFPTEKGKWTEVDVPFDRFIGTWRGMTLRDKKFDPAKVRRLGLLLADKKEGPFELRVDWIRTYGGKADSKGESPDLVAAALADGRFKTLAKALDAAGLVETLQGDGPFTVFAPTDEAFAKLPKGRLAELLKPANREKLQSILKFHVLSGDVDLSGALKAGTAKTVLGGPVTIGFSKGRVKVNDASLVDADVRVSNGVIHVIDSVILPPDPPNDIANVAKKAGTFNTLLAAVEAAGYSDALSAEGPFTLLAPTDEAFKALPKGTLENLLKSENREQLWAVLALHVIPSKVPAGDALNAGTAKSLGGQLKFGIDDGRFRVNDATILKVDLEADNGVIHVIDSVLLPPARSEAGKKMPERMETADMKPAERIENAISRGVPIFNQGDHAGCAAIYMECMTALADDPSLDSDVREALERLAGRLQEVDSDTRRAWMLRSGLDHVYAALHAR